MHKKVGLVFVGQAFVSLMNFVVSFIFLKYSNPSDFGSYTLIFSVALFLVGFQNALINTPLSVYIVTAKCDVQRQGIDSSLWLISNMVAFASIGIAVCILCFFGSWAFTEIIALILFLYTYQLREYFKNRSIVIGDVSTGALSDVVYAIILSVVLTYYLLTNTHIDANSIITAISVALLIALLIFGKQFNNLFLQRISVNAAFVIYKPILDKCSWSVLGVFSTELQSRGYIYILTFYSGVSALGSVQSGRILFGPMNMLISAWGRVFRPRLAEMFGHRETVVGVLVKSCLFFLVFNVVFLVGVLSMWDIIKPIVFSDAYSNVRYYFIVWSLVLIVAQWRGVLSVACQSIKAFKVLSFVNLAGVVISMLMLLMILMYRGVEMVPYSIMVSEVFILLALVVVVKNKAKEGRE
jgi:O-antigen/teichoic acid export membrane protein